MELLAAMLLSFLASAATAPVPAVPNLSTTPPVPAGNAPLPAVPNVVTTPSSPATNQPVPAVPNLVTSPNVTAGAPGAPASVAAESAVGTVPSGQTPGGAPVISDLELERRIQQQLMLSAGIELERHSYKQFGGTSNGGRNRTIPN